MDVREGFHAKPAEMKLSAEVKEAAFASGRPPKVMTAAELAQGHPKVRVSAGFQSISYETGKGSCFGWVWLGFTVIHCFFMFKGLAAGKVEIDDVLIPHPSVWHFLGLGLFYVPFFLIGFALTLARYRVVLAPDKLLVRWRILPFVGWTWDLPIGAEVNVSLARRASESDDRPSEAIVVSSAGQDLAFGTYFETDVKEHLASAIGSYYSVKRGESASPVPPA